MVNYSGRMLNISASKNGESLHIPSDRPLNDAALAALKTVHQTQVSVSFVNETI